MGNKNIEIPKIGTTMYFVCGHLYYDQEGEMPFPLTEFCVCSGTIYSVYKTISGKQWLHIRGMNPDGYRTPYHYKVSEIGESVFLTAKEAALEAKRKTELYEKKFAWAGPHDAHLRRPWANLLQDLEE